MNQIKITRICTILVVIGMILTIGISIISEVASASDGKGSWTTKLPMPTARRELAVGVVNGKLYAIGGYKEGSGTLNSLEEYDPVNNTWSIKPPMQTARRCLAVGVVNGKLYAIGGITKDNEMTGIVEVYNPVLDEWEIRTSMPTARAGLSIGVVNNKIYAIGGRDYPTGSVQYLDTVEVYDPVTDSWTSSPPKPTPCSGSACAVYNNKIFVAGGYYKSPINKLEVFDPVLNIWDTKASLPSELSSLCAITLNSEIYTFGGYKTGSVNSVYKYTPNKDSWSSDTSMPTSRHNLAVGVINGKAYVIGGYKDGQYLTKNEEFSPSFSQNNIKPIVSITFPSENADISSTITILGTALDTDGIIQKVEIRIDSGSWITVSGTTNWSYNWNTTDVNDGGHTIYARSYDSEDYSDVESLNIAVDNQEDTIPDGGTEGTPGFELMLAVIAIAFVLLWKKHKKE